MSETMLSSNIRYYRNEKNMTQLQLADKLFITPQTVSKWERGSSVPDPEKLCAMADIFGVSLDNLVRSRNSKTKKAMIAIDGGGTKTAFVMFCENGEIIDFLTLGGTNPNTYGLEVTQKVLADGIDRLLEKDVDIIGLYAGIAGASVGENKANIQKFLKNRYPFIRSVVEGDIFNVINSAGEIKKCVAVICGTGSVVYGYDGEKLVRAGGWGYLFDEAGSGFDMGRDLFRYCLACEDGAAEKSGLYDATCLEVGGAPIFDHLSNIYAKGKDYIASFSRIVMEFYEQNDPTAKAILKKTVARIAALVKQVRQSADCGNIVIVSGGLTSRSDLLEPLLNLYLDEDLRILIPKMPPIFGAALHCAAIFNREIDSEMFRRNFTERLNQ